MSTSTVAAYERSLLHKAIISAASKKRYRSCRCESLAGTTVAADTGNAQCTRSTMSITTVAAYEHSLLQKAIISAAKRESYRSCRLKAFQK